MTKRWFRGVLAVMAMTVAVFATVAEGGEEQSGGDAGATATPASSVEEPIALGTTVEVAKGWEVTVNSSEANANAQIAAANEFNTPAAGTQYVLVNVSVTNKSDQPDMPFTNLDLKLMPSTGIAIDSAFVAGVPGLIDETAQMQPGATATGGIVYEVPVAEADTVVMLGQSVFTMDAAKDQKFLAIR